MEVTDTRTLNAIHGVADAIVEQMQSVTTKDDEHMVQLGALIDALFIIKETIK